MRNAVAAFIWIISILVVPFQAYAADPTWTGTWDTRWRDGGARMELTQDADHVTGFYPAYGGRVEGTVQGRRLTGRWTEGARTGGLEFVLAPDGLSFMGRFENGEWWTGGRVSTSSQEDAVDQSGPRPVMRAFVESGNRAREGSPDALAAAARLIDFGEDGASLLPGEKIDAAKRLFELVDQTTFHLWALPGEQAQGDKTDIVLRQAGTGASLTVTMVRQDERWFIANPSADVLAAARTALLARSGGRLPPADQFKLRRSPRDALRSFLAGFADWEGGGRQETLAALDLSNLADAVRDYEGDLAAQYLKQVLDRVGSAVPQEVPDDPTSRDDYVSFGHPAGNVVISPVVTGDQTSWKISADSVRTVRNLYIAVEDMPSVKGDVLAPPPTAYFRLRQWIRNNASPLLGSIGDLEIWQAIAWFLVLIVAGALATGLTVGLIRLILSLMGTMSEGAVRELRWPMWMALTFSIYKLIIPVIGLPEFAKRISVGTTGVLLAVALMWGGWRIVDLGADVYFRRKDSRAATMDNIVVSLALGAVKLAILAGGFIFIAIELSLPYEGVIAGLSIGGLAVAFASKETLSNIFGAGTLAIDRPFRRGDWIVAGDTQGTVENVGIRSTRIRTGQDSLVIVPNGKLSDATVNNLGTRRYIITKGTIPVAYGASVDALEAFAKGVKDLVSSVQASIPGRSDVNVTALGSDQIDVEYTICIDARRGSEPGALSKLSLDILRLGDSLGVRIGKPA